MSGFYFHRFFKQYMKMTPKTHALAYRAERLRQTLVHSATITDTIHDVGFHSSRRFYTASRSALGMMPTAFRTDGSGAVIRFAVGQCWLGAILVAATEKGVCAIALGDDPDQLVRDLQDQFVHAEWIDGDADFEKWIAQVIACMVMPQRVCDLPLDMHGTAFEQRVWQALREIPAGMTVSYSALAERIGQPGAARAVASACASNKIAVLVPCHRVLRMDGSLSGYRWGVARKQALLAREKGLS